MAKTTRQKSKQGKPNDVKIDKPEESAVSSDLPDGVSAQSDDAVTAEDDKIDLESKSTENQDNTNENSVLENTSSEDAVAAEAPEGKTEPEQTDDPVEPAPEPEPTMESETTQVATVPAPAPQERRVGFWPVVFGGVVAAMLGFVLGRADQLEPYLPASLQRQAPDLTVFESRIDALAAENQDLAREIEALQSAPDTEPVDTSALEGSIAELTARVETLEDRPVTTGEPSVSPELEATVQSLQATISEQENQLAALQDSIASVADAEESVAQQTLARAALSRVAAALESGSAFEPALADLESTGVINVPQELSISAGEGVPTMSALNAAFPDAAREALAAARSEQASAGGVDLGGFLRRQLGVRSVMPRDGDDPDAVLSRAEAALRKGDLPSALAEIEALPDVARSEMAGWLDQAQARQKALDATKSMAESLTTN